MKNIVLALMVVVLLASCEKRQCYNCVDITTFGSSTPNITQSEHCGWTVDDKQDYIQSHTMNSHNYSSRATCSVK